MTEFEASVRLHRNHEYLPGEIYPKRWSLIVQDEASGCQVLELSLTDVQMAEMLTPSVPTDIAATLSPITTLAKVGKVAWHASLSLARNWDPDNDPSYAKDAMETRARNLIEDGALIDETKATHFDVTSHRDGIKVTFRGWSDDVETAVHEADDTRIALGEFAANGRWVTRSAATSYPNQSSVQADKDSTYREARREGRV